MSNFDHSSAEPSHPRIPNHTLSRQIGHGRHGEVWLACDASGEFRAATVVRQNQYKDSHAFGWEWHDTAEHLAISTTHDGWVQLLYCDQNEEQGYFYCVQELADDESGSEAGTIDLDGYQPRSLFGDLILRRRLSLGDSLRAALIISGAVATAHQRNLICPGLKSSSVLFVHGLPKLAGITRSPSSGALAEMGRADEYTPPEGWGTPPADIYSLGKIIYEIATGLEAKQFPTWPATPNAKENKLSLNLKRVIEKACAPDPKKRHPHAQALCADLLAVQSGHAPASSMGKKLAIAAVVLLAVALGGFFFWGKSNEEKTPPVAAASSAPLPSPVPVSAASKPTPAAPLAGNVKSSLPALPPRLAPPSSPAVSNPAIPPVFQGGRTLFSDDFDQDSSAQWKILRTSDDTAAQFAYDYSVMGIPPAPGSSGTRGLYLAANMALPRSPEAICLSPAGQRFTGNYRLRFHLWMNTYGPFPAGGVGSTQYALMGVGTEGNTLHKGYNRNGQEDGIWFTANGDGDIAGRFDFTAYRADFVFHTNSVGVYAVGTGDTVRNGQDPYFAKTFPGGHTPPAQQIERYPTKQTGTLAQGALGFIWREVEIIKLDDRVVWMVDGLPFASVSINAPNLDGNIFVGYEDFIDTVAEVPELCFAVIDNLVVDEVLPPGSLPPSTSRLRATKTVFSDGFDRDSSAQWSLQQTSEDAAAQFAYDYSAMGIPPAPGTKKTLGLRLMANTAAPPGQESICLSPLRQTFTGNYRLKFDLWMNFHGPFPEGGSGSSQFIMAGVGTEGTRPHRPFGAGENNDGIWFVSAGDGGLILDLAAYRADQVLKCDSPGVYAAAQILGGQDESCRFAEHPYYVESFPAGQKPPPWQTKRYPFIQTGQEGAGSIGLAWRKVEIVKMGERVTWSIDDLLIAMVDLNGMPFGQNWFIGYADPLEGVATQPELCFAIVDNLVVETVEQR